ncbi:hypothetical protein PQX77_014077 [Marasmius sp. AFHP31]|nr:hypothetical protein PQX77_014077 [Marasmius sp. AFHP31]
MSTSLSQLFQPIRLGNLMLSHRVVLAPLTRFRADKNHVPHVQLVKEYYSQRGSEPGTLLISEATLIHPRAGGSAHVPGIWSDTQIEAWKEIVDAVHEKGSYIYLQLWALGRAAYPEQLQSEDPSYAYVSASNVQFSERKEPPRPLTVEEIKEYVQYYAEAAKNAVHKAGFDGVEIHGAQGYLVEQFLKESSNRRTDAYGGSPESRAQFALEMLDAVGKIIKTFDEDPIPTYSYLVKELKKAHPTLAYIHVVDSRVDGILKDVDPADRSNEFIREIWTKGAGGNDAEDGRRLISAGDYSSKTGTELADKKGDLVAFGRWFISNPDLPYRLKYNVPLTPYDRSTFYIQGSLETRGYTDYPFAQRDGVKATGTGLNENVEPASTVVVA